MIPENFQNISLSSLNNLVTNQVAESRTIEYKRELPANDSSSKHEFLADISAFANAVGGDILYGVSEDGQGTAESIAGITGNPDEQILRLQDMLLHGLEERLSGVQFKAISISEDKHVIVVRTPQSLNSPHRVKSNQHFFIRENNRKRQLDVPEIRTAFLRQDSIGEKLRNFRLDRISKIRLQEAPVPLFKGAIILVHAMPMRSIDVSISDYTQYGNARRLPVLGSTANFNRLNIDGVLFHRNIVENGCGAYTQLYRNGYVEALRVFTTELPNGRFNIPSQAYEKEIIQFFTSLVSEFRALEVNSPIALFISILNANSAELGIDNSGRWGLEEHQGRFDRDLILLPDLVFSDFNEPPIKFLKPAFDLIWNACGITHTWNYDEHGNWVERR